MNALKNLKLGARLGLGFGLLLVLLMSVALLSVAKMGSIHSQLEEVAEVNNQETQLAVSMRISVNQVGAALRDIVLLTNDDEARAVAQSLKQSRTDYDNAERSLGDMFDRKEKTSDDERALFVKVRAMKDLTRPLVDKILELSVANNNEEAILVLMKEMKPAQKKWLQALGELAELKRRHSEADAVAAEQTYRQARLWMILLSGAGVALGAFAAWWITVSITRPLAVAVKVAQTVAAGDLGSRIEVGSRDETGELLVALRFMNESLVKVVGTVRASSESISSGASQIASGNADLSQRTEQQASSLEQTAASMEELNATVKNNADTARQATELAAAASSVAARGGEVVAQVVTTMSDITDSSKKISDIIGVIDGIAFQTNILALNAAVEAARAGEQGRGFAVVASEVRSLAQRSAQAAKEIKGLIGASVEKVEAGSRLVSDAGATMNDIVEQVHKVADLIAEISTATTEQSSGIGQVNTAIEQLDQVTQQNAALVEESAAAADSLTQQTQRLVEAVSVFKLGLA